MQKSDNSKMTTIDHPQSSKKSKNNLKCFQSNMCSLLVEKASYIKRVGDQNHEVFLYCSLHGLSQKEKSNYLFR